MYRTSRQHVLAELERLDLLLRVQVWRARQARGEAGELAAFYIPDAEADELLDKAIGQPLWAGVPLPPQVLTAVQARLDELSRDIAEQTAQSLSQGVRLRLAALAAMFGLTTFDTDVILLCLAPELDRSYQRLYAYLQDDVARRLPMVDLAVSLFCPDLDAKLSARTRFAPAAPLRRFHLLELHAAPEETLLDSALRLDPRVAGFLLDDRDRDGTDTIDARLREYATITPAGADAVEPVFPGTFGERLSRLTGVAPAASILYFEGPHGVGKRTAAAAICLAVGRPLLTVAGSRLADAGAAEFATLTALAGREAKLHGALLLWADFDALLDQEDDPRLTDLFAVLDALERPVFLTGTVPWEPSGTRRGIDFLRITFPRPGPDERLRLWRTALADAAADLEPGLPDLAGAFRLTGGQIGDAASTARTMALARASTSAPARVIPPITASDLHAACRFHSNRKLAELAVQITPHYTWDDIVLPADQMAQLREIHDQVRHRHLVYGTWGFDRKLAMGKGLAILFAGPPGTGKTMAADVLAHALGLNMYKIDLSSVVSKYIGETEKNLARIFAEATTSNAILFFDEADALFGKRTQVRDAHDRYANVEISYLLQKMEEYDGVVVLATNLRGNMDEAFVRRLHATVEFALPGVADRRRIWEQIWPAAMPRDASLDLDFLARRIEVAGGSIRNIALAGAFLAAADGGVVTMGHVLHATRREYQKMGKVLTAAELNAPGVLPFRELHQPEDRPKDMRVHEPDRDPRARGYLAQLEHRPLRTSRRVKRVLSHGFIGAGRDRRSRSRLSGRQQVDTPGDALWRPVGRARLGPADRRVPARQGDIGARYRAAARWCELSACGPECSLRGGTQVVIEAVEIGASQRPQVELLGSAAICAKLAPICPHQYPQAAQFLLFLHW
jgi:AAA+ superfamily predicted ATPase